MKILWTGPFVITCASLYFKGHVRCKYICTQTWKEELVTYPSLDCDQDPLPEKRHFFGLVACWAPYGQTLFSFSFGVGFLPHGIAEQMQQNASQKTNCQCVQLHSRTQAYNNCLFCLVHYLEWLLDAVTTPEYTQSTPGLCSWVPTSVSKNSWFQFWLVRTGSKPRLDFQNGNYPVTSASELWNFLLKQQTGFQELFSWLTDLCRERERGSTIVQLTNHFVPSSESITAIWKISMPVCMQVRKTVSHLQLSTIMLELWHVCKLLSVDKKAILYQWQSIGCSSYNSDCTKNHPLKLFVDKWVVR